MKNYTVTNSERLRKICIEHNWFNCGTSKQFEKLFYANAMGCPIDEISTIIWLCSDEEYCRRDILSCLIDERRNYLQIMGGEEE